MSQYPPPQGYPQQQQQGYYQPPPQEGYYPPQQQGGYYQPAPPPQTIVVQQQPQKEDNSCCCGCEWQLVSHLESSMDGIDLNFWTLVLQQDSNWAIKKDVLVDQLKKGGLPSSLRGLLWPLFSKATCLDETYRELLNQSSPHEKWIQRDLNRTFPNHVYFKTGEGQERLFHLIKVYSLWDPEVGYCQGIHFLAGCLLLYVPEEAAFAVLVRLMSHYGLRRQFIPKMEGLHERMFQWDQLLSLYLPNVDRHLKSQGVESSMYASQWFMTFFAYRCSLDLVFVVLDSVLIEGAHQILHFALALMSRQQEKILTLEFESLLAFLASPVFEVYDQNPTAWIQDAYALKISPSQLAKSSRQYQTQMAQKEKQAILEESVRKEHIDLTKKYQQSRQDYLTLYTDHQQTKTQLAQVQISIQQLCQAQETIVHDLSLTRTHIAQIQVGGQHRHQLDTLATQNAMLVHTNSELEHRLASLESLMIDWKLKEAELENENHTLQKKVESVLDK
ncbi:rab-GTPase-TBC domain-containing protein [Sporodiniella umbellata]|nr:rab-GTPase-TBC domain-containing protein [Sporodiniella umbellata]